MLHKLRRRFSDITLFFFDTHKLFEDALDAPEQFPLLADVKTVTTSCDAYLV